MWRDGVDEKYASRKLFVIRRKISPVALIYVQFNVVRARVLYLRVSHT